MSKESLERGVRFSPAWNRTGPTYDLKPKQTLSIHRLLSTNLKIKYVLSNLKLNEISMIYLNFLQLLLKQMYKIIHEITFESYFLIIIFLKTNVKQIIIQNPVDV